MAFILLINNLFNHISNWHVDRKTMFVKIEKGVPGWLSQLTIWLLILIQVMISGLWDGTPLWAPCLRLSSYCSTPLPNFSLSKRKKSGKKKRLVWCTNFCIAQEIVWNVFLGQLWTRDANLDVGILLVIESLRMGERADNGGETHRTQVKGLGK